MTPLELYGLSLGTRWSKGIQAKIGPLTEQCYWCGAKCGQAWPHGETFSQHTHAKNRGNPRCPGDPYLCEGCFQFRYKRFTAFRLDGTYRDLQTGPTNSWWLTRETARIVDSPLYWRVYELLLQPPHTFCLSIITTAKVNELHQCVVNDFVEIKADTQLWFSLDNVALSYSVYELEQAVSNPEAQRSPGIRRLMDLLGPPRLAIESEENRGASPRASHGKEQQAGPAASKRLKETVAVSGQKPLSVA